MSAVTLAVIAKAPRPGYVKTRLTPPLTPTQAAGLAEAALRDTLAAVAVTRAARRVLILDGSPGAWLPAGFEVIPQRGLGLDERLAHAFTDIGGATLIVGMDTPQLTGELLEGAVRELSRVPAVLGPCWDGGYWAIGLREPCGEVLQGVPMSTTGTLAAQRARLRALSLSFSELATLRDVDTFADAQSVAAQAPASDFAVKLAAAVAVASQRSTPAARADW